MKGEKAFRILARVTVRKKLGYFLSCEVGTYLSTSHKPPEIYYIYQDYQLNILIQYPLKKI
jgi:hypothetical protein